MSQGGLVFPRPGLYNFERHAVLEDCDLSGVLPVRCQISFAGRHEADVGVAQRLGQVHPPWTQLAKRPSTKPQKI